MSDRYLHEGETLLCDRRSSPAMLILVLLRGLADAVFVSIFCAIAMLILSVMLSTTVLWWLLIALSLLILLLIEYQRVSRWKHATFRVTTERILIDNPRTFFHAPMNTVKWPQYQECEADHRQFLDVLFFARPLKIRYGTADALHEAKFPSLTYAEDLKHYLDKVDAAIRRQDIASIKPFVAKGRGRRDTDDNSLIR